MSIKEKRKLFTTDQVDDEVFMCADLHINETFKDGLEFVYERQNGSENKFIVYRQGINELATFLNNWLEENK